MQKDGFLKCGWHEKIYCLNWTSRSSANAKGPSENNFPKDAQRRPSAARKASKPYLPSRYGARAWRSPSTTLGAVSLSNGCAPVAASRFRGSYFSMAPKLMILRPSFLIAQSTKDISLLSQIISCKDFMAHNLFVAKSFLHVHFNSSVIAYFPLHDN